MDLGGTYTSNVTLSTSNNTEFIVQGSSTKTITGDSYLYPLIPFDRRKLLKLIFRWKKEVDNK